MGLPDAVEANGVIDDLDPHGAAYALVLAAGGSSRFGATKMLANWKGEPLVRAAVGVALASPVRGVVAVLGSSADEIAVVLHDMGEGRLRLVVNQDWPSGLASSLLIGLKALPPDAARVVVFLGDMPLVSAALAAQLLESLSSGSAALPLYQGQPAHPVAFGRSVFDALDGLRGDQGARSMLQRLSDAVLIDTEEPGSVFDVDYPADVS